MYIKYLSESKLKNILLLSDKLKNKTTEIKMQILKSENNIEVLNKKIDDCYNDKLEGNITLDMYKRICNNLILQIKLNETKIEEYRKTYLN